MKNFLSRLRHWLRKPASTNCHEFCPTCKHFKLCMMETAPEMVHQNQPEYMPMPKEFRCCICQSRNDCPAYDTGVIFPCTYFKEVEHHGTEE